jgi:type IV pilus assembly protein PilF
MSARLPLTLLLALALAAGGCQQAPVAEDPKVDRARLAEINTELGVQYMQKRDYEVALEKLNKAIQLDPSYVDAHNTLGLLRSTLGQHDLAEAAFQQALRLDPLDSSALNNYGQFLCQRERYAEGEKLFLKAVENPLYRNPEVAYSNAGTCVASAGDLDKAETYFRKALEINSELAPALFQMADLSFRLERHLPARAYLQRYVQAAGHSARSLWLGVQIERALGNRDEAASYALMLEKNYPDSLQTKQLLDSKVK